MTNTKPEALRLAAEMALEALEELRFANAPFLDEAMEALRTALAQPEQWKTCRHCGFDYKPPKADKWFPLAQPVDTVNTSQECVDETAKREHEPVVGTKTWVEDGKVFTQNMYASDIYITPPKREWVGLTKEDMPDED